MTFFVQIYLSDAAIPDLPLKLPKILKKYLRRLVNCSIILTRTDPSSGNVSQYALIHLTDPSSGNVSQYALTINFCELFYIKIFFDFF